MAKFFTEAEPDPYAHESLFDPEVCDRCHQPFLVRKDDPRPERVLCKACLIRVTQPHQRQGVA